MIDWDDYINFTEDEFRCKCGCGRADMVPSYMYRLQRIRDVFRRPMVITSGHRCPKHDRAVGGAGVHSTGHAADIRVSGRDCFKLVNLAMVKGMTGIGVLQHGDHAGRFLHLDDLSGPTRPWVWSYK